MRLGYFLSSEQYSPTELVRQARLAEDAGFDRVWISDHFHPWNDEQGHSGFVWSTIGAVASATENLRVTTGVTCPTIRIHPAVIAQAAATSAVLLDGRFQLGVGSGEALNEQILGDRWPEADVRLDMLEEAIAVMRLLWRGGQRSHHGEHYRVERARIYDLPDQPIDVLVSAFGSKATDLAARVGDGFCVVTPDDDHIKQYRAAGGKGPVQAGAKVCWGADEAACRERALRLWPNDALPGELPQILPTPSHFEQAAELVTEDMVAEAAPCGPGLDAHVAHFDQYAEAGVDELFVCQIGEDVDGFFDAYRDEILPRYRN